MTSSRHGSATECFVYLTLPDAVDQVVAGRVEFLTRDNGKVARFVYGKSYLERKNAVAIDPVELDRLVGTPFTRPDDLFGAIRDASPDSWGRRLIDRALGGEASEVGYLLDSPDDGAGALSFGTGPNPPAPRKDFNRRFLLPELQKTAAAVLADEPIASARDARHVARLLSHGTSMGGARPKAVIEDDGVLWLAKFSRADDPYDICKLEKATLDLGAECGIAVAHSRVETIGGRSVLMVKRFDREPCDRGWLRHRMISGLTALRSHESDRSRWSYLSLADELRRTSREPGRDPRELFARAVFNMLVNNDDDHPRNHAMIADERGWRLAPAYDMVPRPTISNERFLSMKVGDLGALATEGNLMSRPERFLVSEPEAKAMIDRIRAIVERRWYPLCRAAAMTEADCERIRGAFLNPGFDWTRDDGSSIGR